MAGTVHNPATPYVGPIQGGLHDGMQIHVAGIAEAHHNGFLISLQSGGSIDPRSNTALAFNPRFADNQVVRNSLQHGAWGTEERHGSFPFRKGHHFEVTIQVHHHSYRVSVDGRHFCDFNHRIPMQQVTHIAIEQGIRIKHIRFDHHGGHHGHHQAGSGMGAAIGNFVGGVLSNLAHQPPSGSPAGSYPPASGGGYPGGPGGPIMNPPVPFVHNAGGMYPNKMIFISGIPHPNASRFTVYLQHGRHHEPHDISLCVDARFNYGNDRNVVVRNSKVSGGWGTEERGVAYFPFMPNASFDMIIMVEPYCWKVAVNNQHLLEYNHRVQPLSRVDHVRVDGDVRLTQVRFQ